MKKIFSIVLLLLFLITNSGMAVNMHWCGGKLSSIRISASSKHTCKCGKKSMKRNCCKNISTTFTAKNDIAKVRHFDFKVPIENFSIATINQNEVLPSQNFQLSASNFYHPPPTKHKVPIYLFDKVFRI
ncbi:MAG: hypothetical protein JST20_11460 [Bacteroidetes bacterium]|nr:hypothetical protein [Bacteroidota bacterium]